MEKKKEILRLVVADGSKPQSYIDYLNISFEVVLVDVATVKRSTDIDLILFTGGADVNPDYYYEEVGKYTQINAERDKKESNIFHKFIGIPKLGICRGAQFLTVMSGGKLIQHVEGHGVTHKIHIGQYGSFMIPSTHHQMMFPYNLSDDRYIIKGWSTNFLSTTYLNGKNKEIDLPKDFLEAEVVEYLKTKCLCIQGHPEMGDEDIKNITLRLVRNFLNKFKKKEEFVDIDNIEEEVDSDAPFGKPVYKRYISSPPTFKNNDIGIRSGGSSSSQKIWQQIHEAERRSMQPVTSISNSNSSSFKFEVMKDDIVHGDPFGEQLIYGTKTSKVDLGEEKAKSETPSYDSPTLKNYRDWANHYMSEAEKSVINTLDTDLKD